MSSFCPVPSALFRIMTATYSLHLSLSESPSETKRMATKWTRVHRKRQVIQFYVRCGAGYVLFKTYCLTETLLLTPLSPSSSTQPVTKQAQSQAKPSFCSCARLPTTWDPITSATKGATLVPTLFGPVQQWPSILLTKTSSRLCYWEDGNLTLSLPTSDHKSLNCLPTCHK